MSRSRKVLVALGIVLVAAILIPIIHHYQLRAAVNDYIVELKAKGEPMELSQVIPPPVPPEQNSASNFLKATSLLDTHWNVLGSNPPPVMRMVAPGKAMIGPAQIEIRDGKVTNSWQDVASTLAQESEALNLLCQINSGSALDFGLVYSNGVDKIQYTHLAPLKRAAQALSAAAISDLHHGDTASAVKNTRAMLALANGMSHDRLIISELVRIAITQMAVSANWELLQTTNVMDEQLAELQDDWMSLDFVRGDENALAMERVTGRITSAKWRGSGSELEYYLDSWTRLGLSDKKETALDKLKIKTKVVLWRYWWSYPDELRELKSYEVFLETARFAETNHSYQTAIINQRNELAALKLNLTNDALNVFLNPAQGDMHSLLSQDVTSLSAVFNKVMRVETAKQATIAAIALKRYQLKYGNYPTNLDSLVPDFVPTVPLDSVDGRPLRYRLNADGTFLLYSVGENGKDDGGDPSLEKGVHPSSFYWQNAHALDWVWPQPAMPEEVQNYYEHPPK